jgi:hypothetical protein
LLIDSVPGALYLAFTRRTCSSSSANDGRSVENLGRLGHALFGDARERPDQPVRKQNAQEGADQRLRDHLAEHGGRFVGGGHGVHHAHHRGDDPEGRHRVADLGQRVSGRFAFLVMRLDFLVHQAFDFERIHVAAHHQTQVVGQELDDVVVGENLRVLGEDRAFRRIVDVRFERQRAFLARFGQQDVEERHQLHIDVLVVLGSFEEGRNNAQRRLDRLHSVTENERAEARAGDHQHFNRLQQRAEMAAFQRVTAENGQQRHECSHEN